MNYFLILFYTFFAFLIFNIFNNFTYIPMKNILNDVKEIITLNTSHRQSFITQLVVIFILFCAYMNQSHSLQYYYNTISGRIILISLFVISCNYRYMFVTLALIACIFFISFKTYEGFSLTDVDSISSSIKSSLPASMVSLPPNPTPQNIYDYLNKQVCTSGNTDIYKQIYQSTSSSDDAKLLAGNGIGINYAICNTDSPYYQKPQLLFDGLKKSCAPSPDSNDKKIADLTSSIIADHNSSNIFSAPLMAIAKWYSTTRSAICGAAAAVPVTSTTSNPATKS